MTDEPQDTSIQTQRRIQMRVIVESPYASDNPKIVEHNKRYARACLSDSLQRGEFPFASHLLYTQVLEDDDPDERRIGINAGLGWMERSDLVAVYTDLGITEGMKLGIEEASLMGIRIEFREIEEWDQPTNYQLQSEDTDL